MTLKAYSPSDDDFVEDEFTTKRVGGSSKADKPVSKKPKKPATAANFKPSGSSKPSKLVLSEDLKPGLNLCQILQPNQDKFPMIKIKKISWSII